MNPKEDDALKELSECQGSVSYAEYTPEERRTMKALQELGYVDLVFVITEKGKSQLKHGTFAVQEKS